VTVDATPEQVWEALTNPAQVDSWFMGRSEIDPRLGGAVKTDLGDFVMESTVVAWEPGRRLRHETDTGPDGRRMAFEYLIEGQGGKTVIRVVHSGVLGDDWEGEYEALKEGNPVYVRKLAAYLTHFAGRTAPRAQRCWIGTGPGPC
jgi:uncharacterized protein YndB with AHSA1/START domain